MLRLLLIVVAFAVVTYLVTRALQERGPAGRSAHPASGRRPGQGLFAALPKLFPNLGRSEPPRPVAPDDDEDFLRDLDRKKRQPPEDA